MIATISRRRRCRARAARQPITGRHARGRPATAGPAEDRLGRRGVTNGVVYMSGLPDPFPADTDLDDAYTRAFEILGTLARAGVAWGDVVEVNSVHTDANAQIEAMAAVKRRYRAAPDPAWTAVGTSALLSPNGITEIALIAKLPKPR